MVEFTLQRRGFCHNLITSALEDLVEDIIIATLYHDKHDIVVQPSLVTNTWDGSYSIKLFLPEDVVGSWDLDIQFNHTSALGMPWRGGIITQYPVVEEHLDPGLPLWAFMLIILGVLLVILMVSYATVRLYKFRQKLNRYDEFIKAGKVCLYCVICVYY